MYNVFGIAFSKFTNSLWIIQTTSLKVENLALVEYVSAVASTRVQSFSSEKKIVNKLC
jgi:hypothetical protein